MDGTIVAAASMSLLLAGRYGSHGGLLPWTLLIVASLASLGAHIAAAEPTVIGVIAAWPSGALIGAYEMLMRQVRRFASVEASVVADMTSDADADGDSQRSAAHSIAALPRRAADRAVQRQTWQWAQANLLPDGGLPTGEAIAGAFQRSARWGRMVKNAGLAGELGYRAIILCQGLWPAVGGGSIRTKHRSDGSSAVSAGRPPYGSLFWPLRGDTSPCGDNYPSLSTWRSGEIGEIELPVMWSRRYSASEMPRKLGAYSLTPGMGSSLFTLPTDSTSRS